MTAFGPWRAPGLTRRQDAAWGVGHGTAMTICISGRWSLGRVPMMAPCNGASAGTDAAMQRMQAAPARAT